ncbi:hypothetical protein [Haloarchaeobius iranensis]|uniref:hypothetical protein n=1 Tax=Haloarchaeobius iranensis TaxID=996166 RepID=UPI000B7C7A8C|nr:hypothetical protein [Haloarchaeobius iranensis]
MSEDDDPTAIRSLAIHASDVLAALEACEQGTETVLRVTPPFNGRMRARIHRIGADGTTEGRDEGTGAFHVPPSRLVDDDAPPYPRAVDTEPEGEYDVETHHERHVTAVEEWREAVTRHLVNEVSLSTPAGEHRVDVAVLG